MHYRNIKGTHESSTVSPTFSVAGGGKETKGMGENEERPALAPSQAT